MVVAAKIYLGKFLSKFQREKIYTIARSFTFIKA